MNPSQNSNYIYIVMYHHSNECLIFILIVLCSFTYECPVIFNVHKLQFDKTRLLGIFYALGMYLCVNVYMKCIFTKS